MGSAPGELPKDDRDEIVDFVRFIDRYENIKKNEQIKKFQDKIKQGKGLSDKERRTLHSLLPVDVDRETIMKNQQKRKVTTQETIYPYDRKAAVDYAHQWWDGRNNEEYGFYYWYHDCNEENPECWNDCTNFVSQALQKGGMVEWYGGMLPPEYDWYYNDWWLLGPSHTWGGANNFFQHMKVRAKLTDNPLDLDIGDVININFSNDPDVDHTAIIMVADGIVRKRTQHTEDKKDVDISDVLNQRGFTVYMWELDQANRQGPFVPPK
ncbi:amidase domain-containing protein [Polycladomyces sp. WAk]|uniref:Amidase domain-containing protein n=1 Tax=Polycladomyces zharkentensis TaxID=2807616 RepID=A0ABS2WFF2_9BACL|nr:amidase domain-containing protein [Polycladomyces sp. WAk]MBN2908196.1 amidase domain-containing protein [Polycladomyces sp. WAk]